MESSAVSVISRYQEEGVESVQVCLDAIQHRAQDLADALEKHCSTLRNVSSELSQASSAYMFLYRSSAQKLTDAVESNEAVLEEVLAKVAQLDSGMEDVGMLATQISDIKETLGYLEDMWDIQMNEDPDKPKLLRHYQQKEGYWRKRMAAIDAENTAAAAGITEAPAAQPAVTSGTVQTSSEAAVVELGDDPLQQQVPL